MILRYPTQKNKTFAQIQILSYLKGSSQASSVISTSIIRHLVLLLDFSFLFIVERQKILSHSVLSLPTE